MAGHRARHAWLARATARFDPRLGAWLLNAALLCTYGCFMEGYGLYPDAGGADTAPQGEPPSRASGSAGDASDEADGEREPDGEARAPTGDSAVTPALDGGATGADSGRDGGASDSGSAGGKEMDSAADALIADVSDSGTPNADAGDAGRDGGSLDAGSACTGATTCAPQCNTSPCALDCADAGTCDVTCRAGQTCNIDCGNSGTCNVICQAGALCHTQCINIDFCPVDCQPGASCRNTCATGNGCDFATLCTRSLRKCGQIAACGDDVSC